MMHTHDLDCMLFKFVCRDIMPLKYPGMNKPFMFGKYAVATDGKAMLLIKDHALSSVNELAVPNLLDLLNTAHLIPDHKYAKLVLPLRQATFTIEWCEECSNDGCDECDKRGFELIDSDANITEYEIYGHPVKLNIKYLNFLKGLERLSWAVTTHAKRTLIVIKHEHGYCLIMGCN